MRVELSEGTDRRVITQVITALATTCTRGSTTFGRARVCADTSTDTHELKSMHGGRFSLAIDSDLSGSRACLVSTELSNLTKTRSSYPSVYKSPCCQFATRLLQGCPSRGVALFADGYYYL